MFSAGQGETSLGTGCLAIFDQSSLLDILKMLEKMKNYVRNYTFFAHSSITFTAKKCQKAFQVFMYICAARIVVNKIM